MENLSCGLEVMSCPDVEKSIEDARLSDFDFVALPLSHPRYNREFVGLVDQFEPWTRSDTLLNSSMWTNVVVGKLSPWIDLDSPDADIRFNSRKAFKQEVAWATHLSLPAVLAPPPSLHSINYAQTLLQSLLGLSSMSVWLRIPVCSPSSSLSDKYTKEEVDEVRGRRNSPWEWWNNVRTLCENHPHLGVVLELTEMLPEEKVLSQWLGEPLRAVILPTNIFKLNKSGFPTLSKQHQAFVIQVFSYKVQFIITGVNRSKNGLKDYVQYLSYLWKGRPNQSSEAQIEAPYLDYLQAPLQPLMDNLESQTYEVFERDPIKYKMYQKAVYEALMDGQGGESPVVMVVGAGRGPLVRASLSAARQAKKNIRVYAVEKNPNAVVTLKSAKRAEAWDNVTIVDSDMRCWDAPEACDILVSELLGSFGDNELSPECLDGAQKFLKATGVSIPCAYTSYLSPMSSEKLHNEVKNYGDLAHFETPYVCKYHNAHILAESQPVFTFIHPNVDHKAFPADLAKSLNGIHGIHKVTQLDNSRYIKLIFEVNTDSTVHGFAGYFDCKLYKNVHISINPANFSTGMFSWFPIYFPLRHPMHVSQGQKLEVHFWRNLNTKKVWYEWCISSPDVSPIHNPNGRSYWIGL
eukprot:TRINITY_DN6562_c0_g1_i1.p1 TRINITY_DN6562_c0_g1~~TRINITY_DN6562_c0_g1_i1.p1  ORF type:complete len:633 (+),score=164.75 TRINITY_DN6562_c0_g1_i1:120-2018(+)